MVCRGALARAIALGVATLAVGLAGACSSTPADEAPIRLPPRVPSSEAGDGAGPSDATVADVATPDGSSSQCSDGKKNGAETDVDCGGPTCSPCAKGRTCVTGKDCAALVCVGTVCSADVGCADATREGFTPAASFPNIAACAGGWSVPGLLGAATKTPACAHASGNSGLNTTGAGCSVADLCQVGWHVCESAAEVGAKSGGAGCAAAATVGVFFATRQSGAGGALCGAGANDVFGCGGVGLAPDPGTCAPLDRFSNDLCAALPAGWACGADGLEEANAVTHTGSADGGALCCRD